jgi:hypothetical protein
VGQDFPRLVAVKNWLFIFSPVASPNPENQN